MLDGAVGQVSLVGAEVSSRQLYSSQYSGANAVFLTPYAFNQSGILFAFIIHCRNRSPVRLQVWRPTDVSTIYRMVCQRRVVPTNQQLRRRVVVRVRHFQSLSIAKTPRRYFVLSTSQSE